MNKKFFVSVILAVLSVNVSLFCDQFAEEIWKKGGDDVYLRSVINIIDIEMFGGKLSEYVRVVNWGTDPDGNAAMSFYNGGSWDGTPFVWIGINVNVVDRNNLDFETIYCVLLHEMCHVATFVYDNVMHNESSPEFHRWLSYAQKESRIARNYDISKFNANAYRGAVR